MSTPHAPRRETTSGKRPGGFAQSNHDKYQRLIDAAKELAPITTAVAHPCHASSLAGALDAAKLGLIRPILVGPRAKIEAVADQLQLDISGYELVDVPHSHAAAAEAVQVVARGRAEALMKGSLHTGELLAAVVKRDGGLRTARASATASCMDVPGLRRSADHLRCGGQHRPDAGGQGRHHAERDRSGHALRFPEVRVAILSAIETVNPKVPSTVEAAALCKMADRGQITGGILDGPLALDNAISAEAARSRRSPRRWPAARTCSSSPTWRAATCWRRAWPSWRRRGRGRHRAGREGADHLDQPRRHGHGAAGVVRGRGCCRPGAARERREGDRLKGAPVDDRRDSGHQRRLVEPQVLGVRRRRRRRPRCCCRGQVEGILTAPTFRAKNAARPAGGARSAGRRAPARPRPGAGRDRRLAVAHVRRRSSPGRGRPPRRPRRQGLHRARPSRRGPGRRAREAGAARAAPPAAQPGADPRDARARARAAAGRLLRHRVAPHLPARSRRCSRCPGSSTDAGVRRYGFHGLSYEYIASVLPQFDARAARRQDRGDAPGQRRQHVRPRRRPKRREHDGLHRGSTGCRWARAAARSIPASSST